MHDLLFLAGCVLGCIQRHPFQSIAALGVGLGRAVVTLLRLARQVLVLLGQTWRAIDGPWVRQFGPVVGLVVLAPCLADPALANWLTLFIFGASRGVFSDALRAERATRRRRSASAVANPTPFDAAGYAATRAPFSDAELRRQARAITHALRAGDSALTEEDRHVRMQQRRVIDPTLDERRAARGQSAGRP